METNVPKLHQGPALVLFPCPVILGLCSARLLPIAATSVINSERGTRRTCGSDSAFGIEELCHSKIYSMRTIGTLIDQRMYFLPGCIEKWNESLRANIQPLVCMLCVLVSCDNQMRQQVYAEAHSGRGQTLRAHENAYLICYTHKV